jgi:hypothetical protein
VIISTNSLQRSSTSAWTVPSTSPLSRAKLTPFAYPFSRQRTLRTPPTRPNHLGEQRGASRGIDRTRRATTASRTDPGPIASWATSQHGFPLRLIVPGWYGMTHVKWLRSITVVDEPFRGWQQDVGYRLRDSEEEAARSPASCRAPSWCRGIPELSRGRGSFRRGLAKLEGRAWSGPRTHGYRAGASRGRLSCDAPPVVRLAARAGEVDRPAAIERRLDVAVVSDDVVA